MACLHMASGPRGRRSSLVEVLATDEVDSL